MVSKLIIFEVIILFSALVSSFSCSTTEDDSRNLSIIMISSPFPGHWTNFMIMGRELISRGHNITFIIPELRDMHNRQKDLCNKHGFHCIPVPVDISYNDMRYNATEALTVLQCIRSYMPKLYLTIDKIKHKLTQLNQSTWDLVIIDSMLTMMYHPSFFCDINSSIPTVVLDFTITLLSSLLPQWPFPYTMQHSIMTHDLSFWERLQLGIIHIMSTPVFYVTSLQARFHDPICWWERYSNILPAGHSIPFIVSSVIGFDFPRTSLPMVDYVGPLIKKEQDPLPHDIEIWLNDKRESVIFLSMGTLVISSHKMIKAFVGGIQSNYSVLWIMDKQNQDILNDLNIKLDDRFLIKSWIPQTSVLNHSSIVMSILHGGAGGTHQSLYFGVPVIIIPVAGDQYDIAARVQYWKVGISLDRNIITPDILRETIHKIGSQPLYKKEAKRMSVIFKNAGGVDRAVQLIEFYGSVGYSHLIPSYIKYHWSWIHYYNIDVYCVLISISIICIYLVFRAIRWICNNYCCGEKRKDKKE